MATRSLFTCITSDYLPVLQALYDFCQTFCGAPRKPHPPHPASHPCLWSCDWYSHWLAPCFEHRSKMKLNEQNVLFLLKFTGKCCIIDNPLIVNYRQLPFNEHLYKTNIWCWFLPFFTHFRVTILILYKTYTSLRRTTGNRQRTLEKCFTQLQTPQNGNVGTLHDNKLQIF